MSGNVIACTRHVGLFQCIWSLGLGFLVLLVRSCKEIVYFPELGYLFQVPKQANAKVARVAGTPVFLGRTDWHSHGGWQDGSTDGGWQLGAD